jgi:predicted ATPase
MIMKFRIVLTGAPCSGKTTTLNVLKEKLQNDNTYHFVDEIATKYIEEQRKNHLEPFSDMIKFEHRVLAQQIEEEDAVSEEGSCTILDRSIIDDYAITKTLNFEEPIKAGLLDEFKAAAKTRNYDLVFILDRLPFQKTSGRKENAENEAITQDQVIRETYKQFKAELGYNVISVPVMPVEKRADFIIAEVKQFQMRQYQLAASASVSRQGMFARDKLPIAAEITQQNMNVPVIARVSQP